jgi:hypothetical protein
MQVGKPMRNIKTNLQHLQHAAAAAVQHPKHSNSVVGQIQLSLATPKKPCTLRIILPCR